MRIFRPLRADHPMVTDHMRCADCHQPFHAGQRTTLIAMPQSSDSMTVRALPVHATCAFSGRETPVGIIERIKDGDASPFPVVTDKGQYHFREAGLSE